LLYQKSWKVSVGFVSLFLLYVGLAYLFASFSPQEQIVSLWPPAGVALAGTLLFGKRFLLAVFAGALAFNLGITANLLTLDGGHIVRSSFIAFGLMLQAGVNYLAVQRFRLNILVAPSAYQISVFLLAAFLSCSIGSVIGNLALDFQSFYEFKKVFWQNVFIWWVGDFLGIIFVAPIVLSVFSYLNKNLFSASGAFSGVACPLIILFLIFQVTQQYAEEVIRENTLNDFRFKAKAAENSIKMHMGLYINSLDQLDRELSSREEISNVQFQRLASLLMQDLPGIKAMSWNPIVYPKDLPAFESNFKELMGETTEIRGAQIAPDDPLVVVKYIEPLEDNRGAVGFNVFSNPARKKSMLHAGNAQVATATNIIQLVQAEKNDPGFLIFSPVYKSTNMDDAFKIDDPQRLRGYAVGVFLVSEIIQESFSDDLTDFMDIYVYENNNVSSKVFGNDDVLDAIQSGVGLGYRFIMPFAEHEWDFYLHVSPEMAIAIQVENSIGFLSAEAILGVMAVFVILMIYGRQESLKQIVTLKTYELSKANLELESFAFYDSLTSLPNRRLFVDRLEHALELAARNQSKVAVFFIDLNRFKQINDGLGHATGDAILQEVARRFSDTIRKSDTLARLGGDEFTVMLENAADQDVLTNIGQKLLISLNDPISVDGKELMTSASIGIAVYPQDGLTLEDLMRGADTAMYQAKQSLEKIYFYSEHLLSEANEQLFLDNELPHVLAKGELEIYYQPIFNLNSKAIVSAECLLRWNHPTQGIISPANFIPAAESSGAIVAIGYWVIEQACKKIKDWERRGIVLSKLSVNVSARQLQLKDFYVNVKEIFELNGISPSSIQMEVTESSLLHNAALAISTLDQLRSIGVSIAIDDYGTGYSALNYLKILPVDILKLDRSFINNITERREDYAIIKSTIYLASELGLKVVAEGIENSAQIEMLKSVQCELGQGFWFSKPVPEASIDELLEKNAS
jgi:diguanylate cyclase (GGDEF)-like protein